MAYIDEVLADSPWAYWPCDDPSGLPQDASGNARHVTNIGWSTLSPGGPPTYEQTGVLPSYPGIKSIKMNRSWFDLPALNLQDLDFTLECWLRVDTLASSLVLFSQGEFGFTDWLIYTTLNAEAASPGSTPGDGGVGFGYWNDDLWTAAGLVAVNDTVHFVFRRDHASDESAVYLNGVQVASGSQGGKAVPSTVFGFGSLSNIGNFQTVGHLAVYLDALSDTRILEHYEAGTTLPAEPVLTCDTSTPSSITVGITPTFGAYAHEIYVSQDPVFDPDTDSPLFSDVSLGPAPTSFEITGLDEAEDYYIVVRSLSSGSPAVRDSETLHCQTSAGGAAPAFVSVVYISATEVEFRPEVVSAALEVFYEWRLSASASDWSALIGSSSDTSPSRFIGAGTGITAGQLHKVRVRFRYAGGLSAWTETEWQQPSATATSSAAIGQFTAPGVGFVVTSPVDLEWTLNAGWTATALEVSQDGSSYSVLTTTGLGAGSYTFDPAAGSYDEDALLFFRIAATGGAGTGHIYTAVTVDTDDSIPVKFGPHQPFPISTTEWASVQIIGTGPVWLVPGSDPHTGGGIAGKNGTNAYLVFPSVLAHEGDGFDAFVSGAALASGNALTWWMNEEVSGSFFGLRYVDENGSAIIELSFTFDTVMPLYPTCHPTNLRGSGSWILGVNGAGSDGGGIACAAGTWFGQPCQITGMPHALALSVRRISGTDDYDYTVQVIGDGCIDSASGTLSIPGGLPCGYCVPYLGRIDSQFIGYPLLTGFWWSPDGSQTCSAGQPSGISPATAPSGCDVNCQCVTITPDTLALLGADTISYEITTADDEYFASPLYVRDYEPVNPILADEKFTQCGLPAGNYLGRYIVETASDVTESEPCAFSIIELGISVWAGWRTAADFAGSDPVADFSYAVVSGALVQFTDASYDMDGTIEAWLWQFKDENGTILATSTDQNPSYDFGSIATYQVTLTVQDDDLHTDSITETVSL